MTIPKSYEALAADLASEKIISKTLLGQKEAYMMLADQRKFHLITLMEEIESIKASVDGYESPEHAAQVADELGHQCNILQQRLTVAEQLLQRVIDSSVLSFEQDAPEELESLEADICGALKPAADVPGSTCNQIREESGLSTTKPCAACNNGACIDR